MHVCVCMNICMHIHGHIFIYTHTHIYIYIYIYVSVSRSTYIYVYAHTTIYIYIYIYALIYHHVTSTISVYLPDPLPTPSSIVNRFRWVLKALSCIGTELLYIGSSWSSPAFARLCEGVHMSTSLMSLYLFLQLCSAWLDRLTWIDFVMVDKWPYNCCFMGCCLHDLFNIARSIVV